MPTSPEMSKQCAATLSTREASDPTHHGELLLAVASWRQFSTCKNGVFDPKASKPSVSMHIMTLEVIENL
jgi:hypothetical protein